MDYHEIQCWKKLIGVFNRLYGSKVFDKEDYKSEPIVIKIINDFYYGDTGYIYLGNFIARYRSFEHFKNKFFEMKNKYSPADPEKRKAPYGMKERKEREEAKQREIEARDPDSKATQLKIFSESDFDENNPAEENPEQEDKE